MYAWISTLIPLDILFVCHRKTIMSGTDGRRTIALLNPVLYPLINVH
jgi:hypothetical protein